jgi:DNA-binding LacI/PurR family transcriptional regulator
MRDVAKLAGVSHQTVSRFINAPETVRPEIQQRVQEAISALDYRPLSTARALSRRRSGTIGVVDSGSRIYGQAYMLEAVESAARTAGFATHVAVAGGTGSDDVASAFRQLTAKDVEGIVVMGNTGTVVEAAEKLSAAVPVAMVSSPHGADSTILQVGVDSVSGTATATTHLVDQGSQRIAHVAGPDGWLDAEARIRGWRQALRVAELEPADLYVGDWLPESGYRAGLAIADTGGVDGVVVANDHMALGLLRAFDECGIRVPHDIAVVGFDDLVIAEYTIPPLTTMRQPFDDMGSVCIDQLVRLIRGEPAHDTALPAELIVRRSSQLGSER